MNVVLSLRKDIAAEAIALSLAQEAGAGPDPGQAGAGQGSAGEVGDPPPTCRPARTRLPQNVPELVIAAQ